MEQNKLLKLLFLAAYIAFASVSCWATAEFSTLTFALMAFLYVLDCNCRILYCCIHRQ